MARNINVYNRKLGAMLTKQELIGSAELAQLNERAVKEDTPLARLLIEDEFIDEQTLIGLVSEDCDLTPIDLEKTAIDMEDLAERNGGEPPFTEAEAKRFVVMPVALIGDHLTLAVSNPYDVVTLDDIKLAVGKNIIPVVSTERAIFKAIENSYQAKKRQLEQFVDSIQDDGEVMFADKSEEEDELGDAEADLLNAGGEGSPAVKLANMIILQAVQKGASDIHIEPMEKKMRVRLRIDGVLHEEMSPPKRLENGLISRLKIMTATMNIAERGKPQDGRFQVKVGGRTSDFSVSALPLVHGEKVCMRILDKSNLAGSLDSLAFEPGVLDIIRRSIAAPYGMFLVTGPTGSGKSTTLYSALQAVMTVEDNVNTVEDPVEYEVEGLNQCHVNPKRGLTFAAALRALLRQDPDTIMIGEIRDKETIEIAIKAALTGHLVLSTLHTNDAPSTINRIVDMGVEPLMVASSILAISAQRLGRRLCKACRKPISEASRPSDQQLLEMGFSEEEIASAEIYEANGCSLCNKGYKGRFAMVECLEMTKNVRQKVLQGASNIELRDTAIGEGMVTLRRAGLMNVLRGITTIDEVLRCTAGDED
jgi:type IV pilus assembly protein PilB